VDNTRGDDKLTGEVEKEEEADGESDWRGTGVLVIIDRLCMIPRACSIAIFILITDPPRSNWMLSIPM